MNIQANDVGQLISALLEPNFIQFGDCESTTLFVLFAVIAFDQIWWIRNQMVHLEKSFDSMEVLRKICKEVEMH